jgi:hypothetical protein
MGYSEEVLNSIYDKNDGCCYYCGKRLAFKNYGRIYERGAWEVDHSVPKSRGGTSYLRNLVPACVDCNRSKGTRMGKSVRASSSQSTSSSSGIDWGEIILGGLFVAGLIYAASQLAKSQQQ